jgi:hypothetical protein
VGKATLGAVIERIAVLVDGGHGRRTAPVAYKRVAVPSVGTCVRADKGDAVGVSNRKIETDPSNRFQKRALVNEMHATLGFRLRAPACPQTLIFGRPKATHRPKTTHA